MFSFVCTKKEFMEEFTKGHIVSALERSVSHAYRDIISEESGRVNDSEKASWRATIPYMHPRT